MPQDFQWAFFTISPDLSDYPNRGSEGCDAHCLGAEEVSEGLRPVIT
jgi:hypothetical protein